MLDFIKKNIYLILLSIITLSLGFLTFLTFIDKGFIELSDDNLQLLLILNIIFLILLFIFIFFEINKAIKNDIDKDGFKSNKNILLILVCLPLSHQFLYLFFLYFYFLLLWKNISIRKSQQLLIILTN